MNDKEINELISLMMEKEIRLRHPIEEDRSWKFHYVVNAS